MKNSYLALALLILLCAAFLRFWQLSEYPPGPHYDEGAYLLIARSIAFDGASFFPIVEAYQGREVLYMYLASPLLHLLGDDIFALRLTSAFANVMTVAATVALGRMMFGGRRGWIIGLAAGVMMAISFPQFWLARQAFRAVTLPLMQALALAFLWRGLRSERRPYVWLLIAGVFAGGALYTYMASRLFPFWLAIGGLVVLIADRRRWRMWLPRGLVFFGALVLTALPMAIYALQKPDIFLGRLEEVTQAEQSISLLESIWLHVQMFFIQGDSYFRYNIPNRPYLTLPEGLLMLLGMGVAALHVLRRTTPPIERAACVIALISPLMVIPSVISVGGLPPSHMRSLGMIPLLFILVAIGFEAVIARLPAVLTPRRVWLTLAACLLAGTVYGWSIYRDWAANALVYYENDADLAAAADWLIDQEAAGDLENNQIYVAARDRGHPTVLIRPVPPLIWLGTDSLFWPPPDQNATFIFPRSAPPSSEWRRLLEENASALPSLPLGPDQRTAFEAFRVGMGTEPPPPVQAGDVSIRNPYLTWVGTDSRTQTAAEGTVTVRWRIDEPPPVSDFTPILQVEDDQGAILSRSDAYVTEADRWVEGSILFQQMRVSLHPATPGGSYRLRMAWVARTEDAYASYLNSDGTLAGIWAEVGTLTVASPLEPSSDDVPGIQVPLNPPQRVSDSADLLGWDGSGLILRPGEIIPLWLYWTAVEDNPAYDYRVVMTNDSGQRVTLYDGSPLGGRVSDVAWQAGQTIREPLRLQTPRDIISGDYVLSLETPLVNLPLFSVAVEGIARQFEQPDADSLVSVSFGDRIRLAGYSLSRDAGQIRLHMVWQAIADGSDDLKAFIHLVDSSGSILDQVDQFPQENTYSPALWAAGEFVEETVLLSDVPGGAGLRIGWYNPVTGARLPIAPSVDFYAVALVP